MLISVLICLICSPTTNLSWKCLWQCARVKLRDVYRFYSVLFALVRVYYITTTEGYLMPNEVYTYIYDLYYFSNYCYVSLTIQLNISRLFTHS